MELPSQPLVLQCVHIAVGASGVLLLTARSLAVATLSFCRPSCPVETNILNICHLPDIGQESLRLELSDCILTAAPAGSSVKETEAVVKIAELGSAEQKSESGLSESSVLSFNQNSLLWAKSSSLELAVPGAEHHSDNTGFRPLRTYCAPGPLGHAGPPCDAAQAVHCAPSAGTVGLERNEQHPLGQWGGDRHQG